MIHFSLHQRLQETSQINSLSLFIETIEIWYKMMMTNQSDYIQHFCPALTCSFMRADSRFAPSQWETGYFETMSLFGWVQAYAFLFLSLSLYWIPLSKSLFLISQCTVTPCINDIMTRISLMSKHYETETTEQNANGAITCMGTCLCDVILILCHVKSALNMNETICKWHMLQ